MRGYASVDEGRVTAEHSVGRRIELLLRLPQGHRYQEDPTAPPDGLRGSRCTRSGPVLAPSVEII